MKFVHAADLHLDSPLRGLARYEGAPVARLRGATRRSLQNLVQLCITERVDFLLLAGDLFDGEWRDYATGLFFAAEMSRLREAGIPVVMIRGNHDAESQISRHLRLPQNVVDLSTRAPQTHRFPDLAVAVHGQGFASRAVTEDLAAGYPEPVAGWFNIGLLHTALGGRPGHEPYAPCSLDTLRSKGYDYWALGHVHAREVLSLQPPIVFPGNLQARNIREQGDKGATLVEVREGRVVDLEHRALDVVRFARCAVDVAAVDDRDGALDLARERLLQSVGAAEGRLLCARVTFVGQSRAHGTLHGDRERLEADVRAVANDFGGELWVEKVELHTLPPLACEALQQRGDALGQLLRALSELRNDEQALTELLDEFQDLKRKLPLPLRSGEDGVRLDDPGFLREVLDDVEQLLLVRLLGEDGEGSRA